MVSKGHALSRDELIRVLTAYKGVTTANGLADGTTLIDSNLKDNPSISASAIPEKTILIMSGDAIMEDKGAASFENVTGQITLQGTGFSAQIKAGTIYRILNISSVEIDVAAINTKVGTNVDALGRTTLFAWLLKLFEHGGQGLAYYGEVTTYTDITHFRVSGLTGFGDDYFANNYRVYVGWDKDGAGAAPQGEMQPCSDYDSADGIFTHTAFTAPLEVGDKVLLIHERIAEIADILADVGDASASTLGSIYAILGNPAQSFLAMIGYEGATALANKLTAARAALLDQITALRMAELDAANVPADIDTLLTRLSAVRSGYLDELAAANIPADIDTLLTRITAAVALASVCTEARLAELDAANIPADTDPKVMGRSQIFEKSITSPANTADVVVATITTEPCLIESVVSMPILSNRLT